MLPVLCNPWTKRYLKASKNNTDINSSAFRERRQTLSKIVKKSTLRMYSPAGNNPKFTRKFSPALAIWCGDASLKTPTDFSHKLVLPSSSLLKWCHNHLLSDGRAYPECWLCKNGRNTKPWWCYVSHSFGNNYYFQKKLMRQEQPKDRCLLLLWKHYQSS